MASCALLVSGMMWQNIFIAMTIMLLVVALSYMLGNLLKKEEYVEFSKHELYNVFVTFVLVLSFSAIVAIANEISCSTSNGATLFDLALTGMNNVLNSQVYPLLRMLFMIMLEMSALSNTTAVYGGIKFNPFIGLKYFHSSLNVISFIMESVYASIYIQSFLLIVLRETAFSIIMPVGIFLRVFPITRDAGTFLMALSFSFYTMYPYVYVVSLDVYNQIYSSMNYNSIVSNIQVVKQTIWSKFLTFPEEAMFYVISLGNYSKLRDMFISFGGHLFVALAVPALAIILSVAMANSLIKFLKEVSV